MPEAAKLAADLATAIAFTPDFPELSAAIEHLTSPHFGLDQKTAEKLDLKRW